MARREKTLVCVLAETRAHQLTWEKFKSNVIEPLNADLAVCISVPKKYDLGNPFWQSSKYQWAAPDYGDFGDGFDEVQAQLVKDRENGKAPHWRELLTVKDQWLGGIKGPGQHPGSGGLLIYFRWFLLNNLLRDGLLERYDRFVVTRSDFFWPCPHPPMELLDPHFIWVPDGEGYGGITDRHAVLSRDNIQTYLDIIEPVLKEPGVLAREMRFRTDWNLEKFIKFSLMRRDGDALLKFFPYCMYAVRGLFGKTRWSKGHWDWRRGYFIKYDQEFMTATALSKIMAGPDSWFDLALGSGNLQFNAYISGPQGRCIVAGSSDEDVCLVDRNGDSGHLYSGSSSFPSDQRVLRDDLTFLPASDGAVLLKSNIDGRFYFQNPDGTISKDATKKSGFIFSPRYFT